jgi:hypothetical protein
MVRWRFTAMSTIMIMTITMIIITITRAGRLRQLHYQSVQPVPVPKS